LELNNWILIRNLRVQDFRLEGANMAPHTHNSLPNILTTFFSHYRLTCVTLVAP